MCLAIPSPQVRCVTLKRCAHCQAAKDNCGVTKIIEAIAIMLTTIGGFSRQ